MIKVVFFDFFNTLVRYEPLREEIQARAAAACGLKTDHEGIVRGYTAADLFMTRQNARKHFQKLEPAARADFFAEYERLLLAGAGLDVSREVALKVWEKVSATPTELAPFPDALPTLKDVKARGLKTGLLSNIYRDLDEACAELGLADDLDIKVSSREAGAEKPHAPIFLMALERAGVRPGEAMHVGDQYEGVVVGARAVGIRPVLLDRTGSLAHYADVTRIRTLPEVLTLL